MWKVTNEINKSILERYGILVSSFFELVIKISKYKNKDILLKNEDYLIREFNKEEFLDERLLKINISSVDTIISLIEEIINIDSIVLQEQYELYKYQNKEINNRNYNLSQEYHPNCLKKIFKDYFYNKFFGVDWIWTDLIGKDYKRDMFKSDFKEENKLYACPYCDTDTISNSRNSWIEHFLPKGKFPYVACNSLNLMPSCTACNVSGSGKGEDVKNPIVNQFTTQIGDHLKFEFINGEITIKQNDNVSIENYIELLKLRKRYKEKSVNSRILSTLKVNYNSAFFLKNKDDFDKDSFFDFIHDIGRSNGLYFVQKDLLSYIDEI